MNLSRRHALGAMALAATASTGACRHVRTRDGKVVVTLWFCYGGKVRETLLTLVHRFNASQTRWFVEPTYQGDYFEGLAKLRASLAAGIPPALSHVVGEVVPYLAEARVLEPLDAYPGARAIPFVRALAQSGTYVGGDTRPLVAIPFNRSTPIMYLNRSLLDRAGLAPPDTWDALRAAARALTDAAGTRFGFQVPISWWFWAALVGQAGGEIVERNGRVSLGDEAGVRALSFLQDLVHRDRVMRPPPGRDYDAWQATHQAFLSERSAIIWTSTAFLRYLEDNASFPIVAAPLPRDVRAAVPTGGTFFVVLRAAPDEEKQGAWEFVRWMCEPEQTALWAMRTGYLPVTEPGAQQLGAYYAAHPNALVAYRQLAVAFPWPWQPNLFRVQRDAVEPRLESAVLENLDPRAVLDVARRAAMEPG